MPRKQRRHRRKRRRAAFRHAVFTRAPIRISGGRLNRVRPGEDFLVNERTVELPGLPDELCGLRITHVSDPHVGELVTPDHLEPIVEAVNELGGDLIAITGDFIDLSNEYLPPVVEAVRRLEAPLGVWSVLGNHDHLDNPAELRRAFEEAGLNLLMDRGVRLEHHGRSINVGGIDWSDQARVLSRAVRSVRQQMDPADLNVLLAHHPHAFDPACRAGFDLTLAGHTHGGQMLLSNRRGKKGSIGLANFNFRYTRGLYERGPHRLYVSSGVGSWFPLRFRCPAEITRLELQSTY